MTSWADHDEEGFTLAEVLVASGIMLLVFVMVSITILTATSATENAANEGQSLSPAFLVEQEAQEVLESAWTPGTAGNVTSHCTTSGGGSWSGYGPFIEATTTAIEFCGVVGSSLTAYTYDVYVTGCTSSSCSFEVDKWSTSGTVSVIFKEGGLAPSSAPFSFYKPSSGSWASIATTGGAVSTSNLPSVGAVELTLSTPALGRNGSITTPSEPGTALQRMIVLSNQGDGEA